MSLFESAMKSHGVLENDAYDWEKCDSEDMLTIAGATTTKQLTRLTPAYMGYVSTGRKSHCNKRHCVDSHEIRRCSLCRISWFLHRLSADDIQLLLANTANFAVVVDISVIFQLGKDRGVVRVYTVLVFCALYFHFSDSGDVGLTCMALDEKNSINSIGYNVNIKKMLSTYIQLSFCQSMAVFFQYFKKGSRGKTQSFLGY